MAPIQLPKPRAITGLKRLAMIILVIVVETRGASAQTAIPPSPKDFVMAAAQSDQYEIQAGDVAIAQSQNPQIRAFAREMIVDHNQTSKALARAAAASSLPPPIAAMSSEGAALLAALQSLRGADFDRTYVKQQVLAHQQALAVEQSFAAAGADPNLREVARTTVPLIDRHLKMAQQIDAALDGS